MRSALLVVAVLALAVGGYFYYQANRDFTPWMTDAERKKFCAGFDTNPPGHHPNFWDNGHWIDAVEGRWHYGSPQYRLKYSASPKGHGNAISWYWLFNLNQQSFTQTAQELGDQGFTLLDANSYVEPDNTLHYQGVWHKVQTKAQRDAEAAAQPAAESTHAPPAPPAGAAGTVVEKGLVLQPAAIDRAQLGQRCSVFLKNQPSLGSTEELPEGMFTVRNGVPIVTGTLFSISDRMLIIMNQERGFPVMNEAIDHVVFAQ